MTTDLIHHAFRGRTVRVLVDEHDQPWFVASDVAAVLGYSATSAMTRRLDEDDKGVRVLHTLGGDQTMTVITEPGLYVAVIGSQAPSATEFKRWITHEVLPTIRRTGAYGEPFAPDLSSPAGVVAMAEQFLATARALAESQQRVALLEPRAQVADELLDASGDMSVADAAKSLARSGAQIGSGRLFQVLHELGWIYRGGDSRWHVKQTAIETGRMAALPQSHYHPGTGERVIDAPQPRVTPKGVEFLLRHLSPSRHLVAVG